VKVLPVGLAHVHLSVEVLDVLLDLGEVLEHNSKLRVWVQDTRGQNTRVDVYHELPLREVV